MSAQPERKHEFDASVDDFVPEPPRLVADPGELGRLLQRAQLDWEASLDEPRAWRALYQSMADRQPANAVVFRRAVVGVVLAAMACLAIGLVHGGRWILEPGDSSSGQVARIDKTEATSPAPKRVALGPSAAALETGQYELPDGVRVQLSQRSGARAARSPLATQIALDRGRIELSVEHQPPERTIEVEAGGYRFVVVGTRFAVELDRAAVTLVVSHGRVAVWRGEQALAQVGAGQRWHEQRQDAPAADTPAPAADQAASAPTTEAMRERSRGPDDSGKDCLEPARRGEPRQAERCFQRQSNGSSLGAEAALCELGRLRADVLGDLPGALGALTEHRRRFPAGALASEAELARLDVLLRLGRRDEVLTESQRLLGSRVGAERALELRLLRGKLYRSQGDAAHAEREYAAIAGSPTPAGAEASYRRARCLEELRRPSEAAAEYRRYLARNHRSHQSEVEQRLKELSP
ncbi:MAG: FecR domain-containing protein [Polyangiaceae bacterium]|nr:FecR domain-containing protein [Polyangiaceae bacterium]